MVEDPVSPTQATTGEDLAEEKVAEGVGLSFWLRWYFLPAVLGLVSVIASGLVWWFWGYRPVLFGLMFAVVSGAAVWLSIKVHYAHIFAVNKPTAEDKLEITLYSVPLDLMPEVQIKGSVGYARDNYGRDLMIVRTFDPDTLVGEATWGAGLTSLDFAARWELAEELLEKMKANITKYGEANVRATAHLMGAWDKVARLADEVFKFGDAFEIVREEEKK